MFTISTLALIIFAAILHASFQLGASLLTLLSGHSLGKQRSKQHLASLNLSYIGGVFLASLLLLASLSYAATLMPDTLTVSTTLWTIVAFLNIVIGVCVMLFYFRRRSGTQLWLPRIMAKYLTERTKKTKSSAEAFSLGIGSVIGELAFLIAPLSLMALVLVQKTPYAQVGGLVLYIVIATLPLLVVNAMINFGQPVSTIQRWRERYKYFLQYVAGSGLVIIGAYAFVNYVIGAQILKEIVR